MYIFLIMRHSAFSRNNLSNLNFLLFSFFPIYIDIYIYTPMPSKRIYYAKNCRGYRHLSSYMRICFVNDIQK